MPNGTSMKAAFVREGVGWPPASAEATQLVPFLSESVVLQDTHEGVVTRDNQVSSIVIGRQAVGDLSLTMSYTGLEFFLASVMGFESPQSPYTLDTGVYQHVFESDGTLSDQVWLAGEGWIAGTGLVAGDHKVRHGTWVVDKGVAPWETSGAYLNSLQMQAAAGACTFTSSLLGYVVQYHSATDFGPLTCLREMVTFSGFDMFLSPVAPITSANVLHDVLGASFTLQNNLAAFQTPASRRFFTEPRREAPALLSGSFAIPTYSVSGLDLQGWADEGTALYGLMQFTGRAITDDFSFSLSFWFPKLKLTKYDIAVQGPGQVQQVYEFVGNTRPDAPTGFPAMVKYGPLVIELVNQNEANALID